MHSEGSLPIDNCCFSDAVSSRFESLSTCPVFKNLVEVFDCTKWPLDTTQLLSYGDSNMTELVQHFAPLLEHNSCNIAQIPTEWDILKIDFAISFTLTAVI